jgi:type IV secretion system protein VirD4
MVVLDIKMENHNAFAAARKAQGNSVFVFAPGSLKTHRYNPLDFVRPGPEMATDCQNIAGFLTATANENEWSLAARKLVAALLGYVLTSPLHNEARTIRSAVTVISTGNDIADVLKVLVQTEKDYLPQWVVDDFNQFIAIPERTRGSVLFNVSNAFAPWSSELIADATSASDFDIRKLRREKMTIFIGTPLADLESYRPLIRILFQQIHDVLMRNLPGKDEPHQVLLMLDEFFALGRMTSLASKIAVSAGYGFRMAIVLQNISQLDELYGRATRETLLAGCATKLFVAINDNATAQYVSEALGNYTTDNRTKILGTGITQSARVSVTKIGVPLMRPEALMRMARDKSLLLLASARPLEIEKFRRPSVKFCEAP